MRSLALGSLWLTGCAVIVMAFTEPAKPAQDFVGETGRILYFHVPNAWASFIAFLAAGAWSVRYLIGRRPEHDRAAAAAVELGLLFGALATITGAIWARIQWGAYWNWDPRQTSITLALLFYGAYLALRSAVIDEDTRARASAAYSALGLVVSPFLFFVLPRITYSLHPDPVINARGSVDMEPVMLATLLAGAAAFTGLFFWLHRLRVRLA
jgi:heme exporter protein C